MGWLETCAVDERYRFVMAARLGDEAFAAVCRRFGISRKTGYKVLGRFEAEGVAGLADRSRAPLKPAGMVDAALLEACLAVRRQYPTWGPLKVRAYLEARDASLAWPVASTIGELFAREGLTVKRKLRRRGPPSTLPFGLCLGPNDLWCIDLKGWFLTGDGARCEPLTLCDAYSRYLLRCQVLARTSDEYVWPLLDAAFREFGLPQRIRSDNGPPFASRGVGGLSKLSVKLIKAGVTPERIAPGKPQQNGRLERFHRTLLGDTATPPAPTLRAQQERFVSFQEVYNDIRPHQALGQRPPGEVYSPSPRPWDGILREPEHANADEIRRVRHNGEIRWRGTMIYVNEALAGEPIGLFEDAAGWTAVYGPVELGLLDLKTRRIRSIRKTARGLVDNPSGLSTTPPAQQLQQEENK